MDATPDEGRGSCAGPAGLLGVSEAGPPADPKGVKDPDDRFRLTLSHKLSPWLSKRNHSLSVSKRLFRHDLLLALHVLCRRFDDQQLADQSSSVRVERHLPLIPFASWSDICHRRSRGRERLSSRKGS